MKCNIYRYDYKDAIYKRKINIGNAWINQIHCPDGEYLYYKITLPPVHRIKIQNLKFIDCN
jgi:hypothetical protein